MHNHISLTDKLRLVQEVGEEVIGLDELTTLFESGTSLIAYDGFEPSGQIHIAQGLMRAININKMTRAGIRFKMLVADWHALANNKMGGDLAKIQTVGKYFIEVWKASGMDMSNVEFVWASEMAKDSDYWQLVVQVGKTNVLKRFIRTAEMMGREESLEKLTAANIMYSCMQVADIFKLGAQITQLGIDQRKLNMLAREIGPQLGFWKPVVVSNHMLRGLVKPSSDVHGTSTSNAIQRAIERKMSKSNPDSAIFMTDSHDDIARKINKAYCPEGVIIDNPILEYCKYIIFESFDRLGVDAFTVERPVKWGGDMQFTTYADLERAIETNTLHPQDLKLAVTRALDTLLAPVRNHFEHHAEAHALVEQVKSFQVTR